MTEKEISEKYADIEDKIPSIWKTYEEAGINLAKDLLENGPFSNFEKWGVCDGELIRVISLLMIRVPSLDLSGHINQMFAFAGLYPERMKAFNIVPDKLENR
jgi:hypothetical protein